MKKALFIAAAFSAGLYRGAAESCRVYLGTSAKGEERGIYMSEMDMKTGVLSEPVRVSKAERPGFIVLDSSGK